MQHDLVYSMGLIDYFTDKFVVRLLNFNSDILQPGDRVVLGNFRSTSQNSQFMKHVLDWKLNYRHELAFPQVEIRKTQHETLRGRDGYPD